jgi:hypothetical protein
MVGHEGRDAWNNRWPRDGETCVVSKEVYWKRDALLFDRIHVPFPDEREPLPGIPVELTFGKYDVDVEIKDSDINRSIARHGTGGFAWDTPEQANAAHVAHADETRTNVMRKYGRMGLVVVPSYESYKAYIDDFPEGTAIAYEAALNNLPVVRHDQVSWEQILEFRKDAEATGKYRDIRLWLQQGLAANSVAHASDIISQRIDDYAWAIHKHGLTTITGAITQVFDWKKSAVTVAATGVAMSIGGPLWATIATGLMLSGQATVWIAEQRLKLEETRRGQNREVALLYDAKKKFG